MEIVQKALEPTGIPTFATAWKATQKHQSAPETYIVYNTMTVETEHWDDENRRYKVYVYLNLWTKADPTDSVRSIRKVMRAAGFGMAQEITSYEDDTGYTLVACTWVTNMEDDYGT